MEWTIVPALPEERNDRIWVGLFRGVVAGTAAATLTALTATNSTRPAPVLEHPEIYVPVFLLTGGAIGVLLARPSRGRKVRTAL